MNKLNFYLDAHFEDVWEMLRTPAHLLSRTTEAAGGDPASQENQIESSSTKPESPATGVQRGDRTG